MKKIKSRIVILLLALMMPVVSLLGGGTNETQIYADSISSLSHTASKVFDGQNLTWTKVSNDSNNLKLTTINLYSTEDDTINYYNIDVQYEYSPAGAGKDISGETIKVYTGGWLVSADVTYTLTTRVILPAYIIGNSKFNISLSATSTNATMSINDKTETTINAGELTNAEVELLFTRTCRVGSAPSPSDCTIVAPKLTITCDDVASPTLNVLADSNIDNSVYRTINFKASDDGAGLSYVKYYKGSKDSHSISDEVSLTEVDGKYSFDAEYANDYTIELMDNVGNVTTYVVQKDTSNILNPSISNLKVSNRNKEIEFTLNYTADKIAHSAKDSIYYTILPISEYNQISSDTNAIIDRVLLNSMGELTNISNTISISSLGKGSYIILAVAKDVAGNRCMQAASSTFVFDPTRYTLELPALEGGRYTSILIDGEEYLIADTNKYTLDIYASEEYSIGYQAQAGYVFFDVFVDGEEMNFVQGDTYTYSSIYAKERNVSAKFKYVIDVNFDSEYSFDNIHNALRDNLIDNFSIIHEGSLDVGKSAIEFEVYDSENNLVATYNCTGDITGEFYNVGTYQIVWKITEAYEDSYIRLNNSKSSIQILPKEISGIEYSGYEGLIYTGESLNLSFSLDNSNLSEDEKESLAGLIALTYYYSSDSEKVNSMNSMLNAGVYLVQTSISDNNYTIASDDILNNIVVNKKDVNITLNTREYIYNESIQSLDFANDASLENDAFVVIYSKLNGENYEESIFQRVGNYNYTISLADEYSINYILNLESSVVGSCAINPQDVYFVLNESKYDYIGLDINVDFSVYNSLDEASREEIISINGVFSCVSIEGKPLKEEGIYAVTFVSSDEGYILHLDDGYVIEIIQTTITISIIDKYEFDGTIKSISYTFINENGDVLSSVVGLDLEIYSGDNKVTEVVNVGEYTYKFICQEGYVYELIGGTGTLTVLPAIINVNIVDEYEYNANPDNLDNLGNYDILYSLISTQGTDFGGFGFVSMQITKDDNLTWGDIGEYNYTFVSNNTNVQFQLAEGTASQYAGTIKIVPRKIEVEMTNTYIYSAQEQNLEYTIVNNFGLSVDEISLTIDTMRDAGNYVYTLICLNNNYELVIKNALIDNGNYYITIQRKTIGIASIVKEYVYTGEDIEVSFTLDNPYSETIGYTINRRLDGEIVNSIKDVGTYLFEIYSSNDNYIINFGELAIRVLPKALMVVADENIEKEYNGNIQTIEYSFVDDNQSTINVTSRTIFTKNNLEVSPKFVGEYDYQIVLTNPNYSISEIKGKLTIKPKTLSVSALSSQSKVYGESDNNIEYVVNGLIDGDQVSLILAREEGENVGLYAITYVEGSLNNDNYVVSFRTNTYYFEITQKRLVVIADSAEKIFGEEDNNLTYKMYIGGMSVERLPYEDVLEGKLSRTLGENVGVYDILLGNLNNPNYSITFVSNKFTIVPMNLHIEIDDISVIYGDNKNLTYTVIEDYESSFITGNITREEGENVGDYVISQGTLSSQNYNLIVTNGTYTIGAKDVYVNADYINKTYGDAEELTYNATGLIRGDQLSGALGRESGEDVGVYVINQGSLAHQNYNIIFTPNILTIEKTKLTIRFDDKSQVFGEKETPLTYVVEGLKNNENLIIRAFRESGEDVGEYEITGAFSIPSNYILENFVTGKYTIEKARLNLTLKAKTVTYNGKAHSVEVENFDYPVKLVYKLNGFEVDECVNAGYYTVQAEFEGNNNYYPAKSKEVNLVIEKQYVFITTLNSSFIYDGTIKYPEFSYDKNIGIDENSFIFKFEGDVFPQEEGEYNFAIIINDDNYEGQTQGIVKIQKPLSITNDRSSIVECENATFDDNIKNIKLVQNTDTKKFNNEKVLTVCSLENISTSKNEYIYTVKVKATEGVDNVKVYKVGLSGFSQQAIKIEDGYYVFKIDDPNDKYIITTEIKTLSTLAWVLILVAIVLIFTITLIVVARHKHKKAKVRVEKVSDKDIETYNVN